MKSTEWKRFARDCELYRDKYLKDFVPTPDDVKLIPQIKKQRPKKKDPSYNDENVYIPKSARVAQQQRLNTRAPDDDLQLQDEDDIYSNVSNSDGENDQSLEREPDGYEELAVLPLV